MKTNEFAKFFLVLSLGLVFCFNSIPNASASSDANLEEGNIKETINTYFQQRYEAFVSLKTADFSPISATPNNSATEQWLRQEQDRQEIELFIAKTFNTTYSDFHFNLDYQSIQINGDKAVVRLSESNEVFYTSNPTFPSKMANLIHTITLKYQNDKWKIVDDQYRNETIELLETLPKDKVLNNIQINQDAQFALPALGKQPVQPNALFTYQRGSAVTYADTWAGSINTTYNDYTNNDCTNYASQSIYEGTQHTMSDPTNYNSNWYYDFYSHGGSYPWVNVGGLYTFLTSNTGKGPYGYSSGAYTCNLSQGDVVTMKDGAGWKHTVVVVAITGDCHVASNILVDSHDIDRYHYALSNYSGYTWYAITISGYIK